MTGEWVRPWINTYQQRKVRRASAYELTDGLRASVEDAAASVEKPIYRIRPYRGDGGVRKAMDLLDGMHNVRRSWFRNVTGSNFFEVVFQDEELTFRLAPESVDSATELRDQLYEDYPHSSVSPMERTTPAFARDDYQYVAAANGHLHRDGHLPIRHIDVDGFSYSGDGGDRDPYRKVLTKLTTDPDSAVFLQVAYRPVTQGVLFRRRAKHTARSLETGGYKWIFKNRPAEDHEKAAAETVRAQQTESMYQVAVRVVAAGPTAEAARERLIAAARGLSEYYESSLNQGIYFEPVGTRVPGVGDGAFRRFVTDVAERQATYGDMTATTSELAGLTHLPDEDVQNPDVDWNQSKAGIPVPNRTPRFDFDAAGLDETATADERQRVLMSEPDAGDPLYLGFGARKGTEAGIYEDILDSHAVIPGQNGVGKTTVAKNMFYQLTRRDHGVLYYDPKGMDGEDFAGLVPEDREDDLIFVEVGGDRDHRVAFNFMEPGTDADAGTQAYDESIEQVGQGLETILPMASGRDIESWGTRMSRVTKNIARGLGRMDGTFTVLDMHYLLATEYGRQTYAQGLSDENIQFIEDYARTHLAEMDDDVLEPLAGRLQQFVENPIVRDLISVRDGFDVDEAVADGKIIVVRDRTGKGDAGRMVASALLGRIWTATREQEDDDDRPDPPHFYAMLDEFNDIAAENSGIVNILENARSYGLSVVAMLQDMDAALPQRVEDALAGQTKTKLTYFPGRAGFARTMARYHSEEVTESDLMGLSRYEFYMRTENRNGEKTQSYKVDAFPPIDEIGEDVGRDEAETKALIDRRIREVGTERRTPEEQKRDAMFRADADDSPAEDRDLCDLSDVEAAAAQGVYDASCRFAEPGGAVTLAECAPAVRRRVAALPDAPVDTDDRLATDDDVARRVLQHVHADAIETASAERDGEAVTTYRAASPRSTIATVGEDQSAGGPDHTSLMWDAYAPLTYAGLDVTIASASGDDPDALVRPAPEAEQNAPAFVKRVTGGDEARVEAECTTGESKAGMTARHVLQAAEEGRRTLVLARHETAENVADTLLSPPQFARSDSRAGSTWYYNSPREVTVDGETMTRPGSKDNVWVETDGNLVLRDNAEAEWARFDTPDAIDADADAYPEDGDRTIYKPVHPATYDLDAEPHAEILTVPTGGPDLGGLALLEDADGTTTPADAVDANELDLPDDLGDQPRALAARLADEWDDVDGDGVTITEAHELVDADPDLPDRSRRTVGNWIGTLDDAGVVEQVEDNSKPGNVYTLTRND